MNYSEKNAYFVTSNEKYIRAEILIFISTASKFFIKQNMWLRTLETTSKVWNKFFLLNAPYSESTSEIKVLFLTHLG